MAQNKIKKVDIENVTASKLLGRGSASSGAPAEITLGTGLTMTGDTLNAAGSNSSSSFVFAKNTVTGIGSCVAAVADSSGDVVYAAYSAGTVVKYVISTDTWSTHTTGVTGVTDMVISSTNVLYCCTTGNGGNVYSISTGGALTLENTTNGATCVALCLDETNGYLYVLENTGDVDQVILGGASGILVTYTDGTTSCDIAVDSVGNFIVVRAPASGSTSVRKYNSAGTTQWTSSAASTTSAFKARIAVDLSDDSIYISGLNSGSFITKITSAGSSDTIGVLVGSPSPFSLECFGSVLYISSKTATGISKISVGKYDLVTKEYSDLSGNVATTSETLIAKGSTKLVCFTGAIPFLINV